MEGRSRTAGEERTSKGEKKEEASGRAREEEPWNVARKWRI